VESNCKQRNSRANPRKTVELYDEFVKLKLEADKLRAGNMEEVCVRQVKV